MHERMNRNNPEQQVRNYETTKASYSLNAEVVSDKPAHLAATARAGGQQSTTRSPGPEESDAISLQDIVIKAFGILNTRPLANETKSKEPPLIHTESFNASSPLLFIKSPQQQPQEHNQQVEAAESSFSPSRVSILSASYPSPTRMFELDQKPTANLYADISVQDDETSPIDLSSDQAGLKVVRLASQPRLVVLNLEVGNSSATLTWNLALNQAEPAEVGGSARPDRWLSRRTASARPDGGDIPLLSKQRQLDADKSRILNDEASAALGLLIVEPTTATELIGGGGEQPEGSLRQQKVLVKRAALLSKGHHQSGSENNASRFIKRKTANDSFIDDKEIADSIEQPVAGDDEQLTTTTTARPAAGKHRADHQMSRVPDGDLLRTGLGNSSETLTINDRLRLSQIQTLSQSAQTNPRRPPIRPPASSTTSTMESPPDEPISSSTEAPDPSTTTTTTSTTTKRPRVEGDSRGRQKQNRTRTSGMPVSIVINDNHSSRANANKETQIPMIKTPSILLSRLKVTTSASSNQKPAQGRSREPKSLAHNETLSTSTTSTTERPASVAAESTIVADSNTTLTATTTTTKLPLQTTGEPISPSTRSVQFSEPSTSPKTTAFVNKVAGTERQASTISASSSPARPSQDESSSSTSETVKKVSHDDQSSPPSSSKWLVRLRKFASNEVDIVKIVVDNNLSQRHKLLFRQITFKSLEPSSGYELCIESASPNQSINDLYSILDANYFLKCQDNSVDEVELGNVTTVAPTIATEESIKRSDQQQISKIKSLCKEFFTLPSGASFQDKINFGMNESNAIGLAAASKFNAANFTLANGSRSQQAKNESLNLRKPKSLNNVLKSRMEVLEISENDLNPSKTNFELVATSSLYSQQQRPDGKLSSTASDSSFVTKDLPSLAGRPNLIFNQQSANHNQADFMSQMSILPIVGCVFGLIFILTLANMILNTINCRSQNSNRSASMAARQRAKRRLDAAAAAAAYRNHQHNKQTLGSFYSDHSSSNHSNQSQSSRIVIVGGNKNNDTFANTSAYFEVPIESSPSLEANTSSSGLTANNEGGLGSGSKSSFNQLVNSARFPLGPSFEGDEKHNADMVGLARKNYDNFISNIYGSTNENKHLAGPTINEIFDTPSVASSSKHSVNHQFHSHHKHHNHYHRYNSDSMRTANLQAASKLEPSGSRASEEEQQTCIKVINDGGQSHNQKRQRIRFDKINPIYNMNGIYALRGNNHHKRHKPLKVSTFGHSNQALNDDDEHQVMSPSSTASAASTISGNLANQSERNNLIEQRQQELETCEKCPLCCQEESLRECETSEMMDCSQDKDNWPESQQSSLGGYNCCLDKQKQRFHKQQQQLERVMSKTGSLVPQPFINPIGPPINSTSAVDDSIQTDLGCDSIQIYPNDGEEESAANEPKQVDDYRPEPAKNEATKTLSSKSTSDEPFFPPPPPITGSLPPKSSRAETQRTSPPPEPPPMPASKALVNIKDSSTKAETIHKASIKKEDFEQRRNELANKLNLTGMTLGKK